MYKVTHKKIPNVSFLQNILKQTVAQESRAQKHSFESLHPSLSSVTKLRRKLIDNTM